MIKIGDFSKICRVPVSALRYYADIGLLEPAQVDRFTGYRYYTLDQLPKLNRILALRDLGLSIEQITVILREDLPPAEIRGMLRLRQAEIQQTIEAEQARLARVAERLRRIEQEGQMPSQDIVMKSVEAQRVLAIREIIPTPSHVGHLLGESFMVIMGQTEHPFAPTAPPFCIFHDEEFKPADMDVEIAIPVPPSFKASIPLPGGRELTVREAPRLDQAACLVHVGPFDTISDAYAALGTWIAAGGYQFAGPPREVYLQALSDTEPAITEIQIPVAKSG